MSYDTPHHAHEFMKAAALGVVHQFVLACQRKQVREKQSLLRSKREIDFNSRLSLFFGPEASISAQGVSDSDLRIKSPVLEIELKYLRPKPRQNQPVNSWNQVIGKDWKWLLDLTNGGGVFKKTAFVVFLPSISVFAFHSNFQVPRRTGTGQIKERDYAPFHKLVEPNPQSPRKLQYAPQPWERDVLLKRKGTKVRVRRQIVGRPENPIWGLIFSRVGSKLRTTLKHLPEFELEI